MFKSLMPHLHNKIDRMVLTKNLLVIITITVVILGSFVGYRLLANRTIDELSSVEIKEYQGQKLSSIGEFREKSINGPQHIDPQSYRLTITGLVDRIITYTFC